MICKELKNISENIFGFKKRLSISKIENGDRIPLTEAIFTDQMQSSVESFECVNDDQIEKSKLVLEQKTIDNEIANNLIDTIEIIEQNKKMENKTSLISPKKQYSLSANCEEFQEDWSFTWYDFDGRGKITRKDMSTMMKSLYDIIRHNTKNRNSRFINHYKLHLVLMTEDISNVQGLDLATSYEQIYQLDSMITSLTNLSVVSSDFDDQDSENTIANGNSTKHKHSNRKSFSGRCFEELNEMRARKKEKRSKSTPTDNQLRNKIKDNQYENCIIRKDQYSISTSLKSLAGSSLTIHIEKPKLKRDKTKLVKNKSKRMPKASNDIFKNKTLSSSCQNIANNLITSSDFLDKQKPCRKKHSKCRIKQQKKKDLGRKQVEEWLQSDVRKENEENIGSELQLIHHHYHHYHQSSYSKTNLATDGYIPIQLCDSDINKCLNNEWNGSPLHKLHHHHHHHVHLHHHHHHYFY